MIWLITELRKRFADNGYNIYTISTQVESVLYDLEYIPKEMLEVNEEKIKDFLYWQTFYQQSDGLLWGGYVGDLFISDIIETDMQMSMVWYEEGYMVEIKCDEIIKQIQFKDRIDCDELFRTIIRLLTETSDE